MIVRRTTKSDEAALRKLHEAAFGEGEGSVVADLVMALLHDPTAAPIDSYVACYKTALYGHVLFSQVSIEGAGATSARIMAPLAVVPERQGQGIGAALVHQGLKSLVETGVEWVFVLGDPGYYQRFGFEPAGPLGLDAPYPIPEEQADSWMVLKLNPTAAPIHGMVRCADALNRPEYWVE